MPDGHDPIQFVAEQLRYPVAHSGESVRVNAADVPATDTDAAYDECTFIL